MKIPNSSRKSGFTLIELLVVIAIIAILAAAGFAVGTTAVEKARKTAALAMCTELEMGVNNFFTEYSTLPTTATSDTEVLTNTSSGVDMLKILMAREGTSGTVMNTRQIKFINPKEGKASKNGIIYSQDGSTILGLYDPWGGPYHVMLDGDFDEQLTVQPAGAASKTLNGRHVAVWSNGADGVNGGGKANDNVTTW